MFLNVSILSRCNITILFLSIMFFTPFHKSARAATGEVAEGHKGIVATDYTRCSKIGRDILRLAGAHAVDAAVAATLCLGVKAPFYSGLGGGGFMIVRSSNGKTRVFDMREMAPGRADYGMYNKMPAYNGTGPMSIAVPGQLAGLYKAHKIYGNISWKEVVKPARRLAGSSLKVSKSLYQNLVQRKKHVMADKELKRTFAPNGEILLEGQNFDLKRLAHTLYLIGKYGMDIFYNGSLGQDLARDITNAGGIITTDDLKKYEVKVRDPLVAHAFGYEVVTAPPPAAGGAMMIMILNILATYKEKLKSSSLLMHRTIEALKFALALKMNLGDPDFAKNSILKSMISESDAEKFKNRIKDSKTFPPSHYGSKWSQQQDEGTTHIVVVDKMRNVVTMTMSLNSYKGSQYMSPNTGIILNNHMHDFSYSSSNGQPPSPANSIKPFKRPLSSMAPAILIKDGQVKAVIGAAGGMLIPDAVTQVLINHFMLGMDPQKAIRSPRLYHKLHPNIVYYENHTKDDYQILNDLRKKGHVLREGNIHTNTVCQFVIQHLEGLKHGLLVGVSDPRRKGGDPSAY